MFSNREVATIIWVSIFAIWTISKAKVRASLAITIKSAVRPKLLHFYFSLLLYMTMFSFLLLRLNYWSLKALKDTLLWYLFVAIPLGSNATIPEKRKGLWKNAIVDNLKFLAITEFLIGQFSYSIVIELVQIPIITFIAIIPVFPDATPELKKFANNILATVGVVVLGFTVVSVVKNRSELLSMQTLKSFIHPLAYSIAILPYLFFLSIYSDYDGLFLRVRYSKLDRCGRWIVKLRLMWFCGLIPKRIKIASNMVNYNLMNMKEPSQFNEALESYKSLLQKTSNNSC